MLYILGGSPRCGKSIIALKFVVEKQVPYFCIDCLISTLESGIPQLGIKHGQPFISKAESLWPIVKPLILHVNDHDPNYLIEGDGILPKHVALLQDELKVEIRVAFVGFTTINPQEKLHYIKTFPSLTNDWTATKSDDQLMETIDACIEFSRYLKEECKRYNIAYFDSSENFSQYINAVFSYLISKKP